jgi:hypothetical protein
MLATGIRRGAGVAGGYCAFMGICAAAIGVGIAFAILLESDPCDADVRQQVQRITHEVLGEISRYRAGRCCQRDGWIALRKAAEISERLLPIGLQADAPLPCRQVKQNQECIREACPLYPRNVKAAARRRSEEPEPEPAP